MRKSNHPQLRFDCVSISDLQLNVECRDEIITLLSGLQHVYFHIELRSRLCELVASDVNAQSRADVGREGLSYWQILVLAVVRLGLNVDYDKLQDLCENHRSLRVMLKVGDWEEDQNFGWRRLRDTICLLRPATIKQINESIVGYGHELDSRAAERVRADSFVIETNIHYPTESSLMWDGSRKIFEVVSRLLKTIDMPGWRQADHLRKRIKEQVREVARISASQSPQVKRGLNEAYRKLLKRMDTLLERARELIAASDSLSLDLAEHGLIEQLENWIELTSRVMDTAFRRTQLGETVPNDDKLFSLFETHTQLYRRGKAGEPNQFGRLALIFEDGAGFISHYHLMDRTAQDADVAVEQTREAQRVHKGQIIKASFDRGFHSEQNEQDIASVVNEPCMPPRHRTQYAKCLANASVSFHESRKSHPGIESAIGALQCGNGLKRCRDRTEIGLERYLGLAILGRNFHVLGKLLIARANPKCEAATNHRQAA